jgi:hypothetical protein
MDGKQPAITSPGSGVIAAHERWAYGEGWTAGLDEGKRQGFDEGYGAGFDAGADVGAARLLAALKAVVQEWSPDMLHHQCMGDSQRQRLEGRR